MKLQKLLDQQAALAVQINEVRKAEAQEKKAAVLALTQAKKAAVLRAAERAGLLDLDPDMLAVEFQKIADKFTASVVQPVLNSAEQGGFK